MWIVFSSRFSPFRVCIKARWIGPYVFRRVVADLWSPTSLKDVLLVLRSQETRPGIKIWCRILFPGDHGKLLPGPFWAPHFWQSIFWTQKFGIYSLRPPRNCPRYLRRSTFNVFHRSPSFGGWWSLMDCDALWCTVMHCDGLWCIVIHCDALWWKVHEGAWEGIRVIFPNIDFAKSCLSCSP